MSLSSGEAEDAADDVAACCLIEYDRIAPKGAKPAIRSDGRFEWTILAGVVVQTAGKNHCIALCTGVKTLPYDMLPRRGDMLHDSHAEVLARRAARVWLLKRLLCEVGADDGDATPDGIARIFERDHLAPSRWHLESGTSLHLYCSTLPCGDASSSVLLQQRGGCALEDDEKQQGTLRGRASLGNTHLHLRTKPGRPQSMASISMSCTDKLAMWSVIGMQGSLLSQWMDPIFFRTLVVGTESLADVGQTVMCAAVHSCQTVLQAKVMHAVPEASALQVLPTRMPFVHSREQVVQRLLAARPEASVTGKSDELDYVPAPGSMVWIRGHRVENIVEGRRQGAALPRDRNALLPLSSRSRLTKIDCFSLVLQARIALTPASERGTEATYYQAKHNASSAHVARYRRIKERLRGSASADEQAHLVNTFLAVAQASSGESPAVSGQRRSNDATSAPFIGWLVSGKRFEAFDKNGIYSDTAS